MRMLSGVIPAKLKMYLMYGHITLKATHFRFGSSVVDKGIKRCVEKCIVGRLKILNPDGEEWDIRPLSDKYVGNCKSLIISNFSRKLL